MITFTEQEIHEWESADWRPNGRHEAARPVLTGFPVTDAATAPQLRLLTGADTLRDALRLLPPGLDVYASYVDNFGGFPELLALRGLLGAGAVYFSYTIFGNRANFADCEPGAMHPASVDPWLRDGRGQPLLGNNVPGVYTSAGNANLLFDALGIGGLSHHQLPSRFIYQSAHYGAGPHICGPSTCGFRQAHGTQWTDTGPNGENYDRSLWLPGVLGRHTSPQPKPEDEMLTSVVSAEGHLHVFRENPDGSVDFTYQKKGETTWLGGKAGAHIANFTPFAPARGK